VNVNSERVSKRYGSGVLSKVSNKCIAVRKVATPLRELTIPTILRITILPNITHNYLQYGGETQASYVRCRIRPMFPGLFSTLGTSTVACGVNLVRPSTVCWPAPVKTRLQYTACFSVDKSDTCVWEFSACLRTNTSLSYCIKASAVSVNNWICAVSL